MAHIGEILLREGLISVEQLQRAQQQAKREGGGLGHHLIKLGCIAETQLSFVKETQLLSFLAKPSGLPRELRVTQTFGRSLERLPGFSEATDVAFVDEQIGFVVAAGKVERTVDGGVHWAAVLEVPGIHLSAVRFANARVGYAAGAVRDSGSPAEIEAGIYRTDDGGARWVEVFRRAGMDVRSLATIDAATAIVTGLHETVRTADGGKTWSPVDVTGGLVVSFCPGGTGLLIAGKGRNLFSSTDSGAHFHAVPVSPGNGLFHAAACASPTRWWVGGDGPLLDTDDGGATWRETDVWQPRALAAVGDVVAALGPGSYSGGSFGQNRVRMALSQDAGAHFEVTEMEGDGYGCGLSLTPRTAYFASGSVALIPLDVDRKISAREP